MAQDLLSVDYQLQVARQYAAPLDKYTVFDSLESATSYINSSPSRAYVGQVLSVLEGGKITVYCITPERTLQELGGGGLQTIEATAVASDTEGSADASVKVTNTSTSSKLDFTFQIPIGKPGPQGPTGGVGPTGSPGKDGTGVVTTLNGSTTTGRSIYAPTMTGPTGYVLYAAYNSTVAPAWGPLKVDDGEL